MTCRQYEDPTVPSVSGNKGLGGHRRYCREEECISVSYTEAVSAKKRI